jgi:hypothetical protein
MARILQGTGWKIKKFIESTKSPAYIGIIEKGVTASTFRV